MFKRMLSAFGVGGPTVDTVLDSPVARPGAIVAGRVSIQGGTGEAVIDQVVLSLVTRIEVETSGGEAHGVGEFHRLVAATDVRVPANERLDIPFQLRLPWETPITAVGEVALPGVTVGVRTELVITGAPDRGDLDPLAVQPVASQDRVLDAFGELGATFRSTDVEAGRIAGVPQQLGFYQELEFYPPAGFAGRLNEVELTFVAGHRDLWVVLEAGKRGGLLRQGGDTFGRFQLTHEDAERPTGRRSSATGSRRPPTVPRPTAPITSRDTTAAAAPAWVASSVVASSVVSSVVPSPVSRAACSSAT